MSLQVDQLVALALEAGFDFAGVAPAAPVPHAGALADWLAHRCPEGLAWMARNVDARTDPRCWDPGTGAMLMVGYSYFTGDPPPECWDDPARGRIARYAWGPDYHDVMEPRLETLAERLRALEGAAVVGRVFVDRRPVMERGLAEAAGLGMAGRNAQLIHPRFGAMVWLGGLTLRGQAVASLIREMEIVPSTEPCPETCRTCLDRCPTEALEAPRTVDARRCISYLTIEHRGPIPEALKPRMGRWIFGCDECLEACPLARPRAAARTPRFLAFDPEQHTPRLDEVLAMDEANFLRRYAGTPVQRAGLARLQRNAAIALENSGK